MEIEWLTSATDEFEDAIEWMYVRNPLAADKLAANALYQIDQLKHFPLIGRIGRDTQTRELVISQSHYIAVYRVISLAKLIEIIAFKHEAALWPDEF